jgi:hypothetical protein
MRQLHHHRVPHLGTTLPSGIKIKTERITVPGSVFLSQSLAAGLAGWLLLAAARRRRALATCDPAVCQDPHSDMRRLV